MISKNATAFLFAHQDDEVFADIFLRQAIKWGPVYCIFCTRPSDSKMAEKRRLESLKGLKALGLSEKDIFFMGDELGIFDAHLPGSIGVLLASLMTFLVSLNVSAVYVPAWEGGHHDHDALAIAGLAIQKCMHPNVSLTQYSLYHGERTSGKFFQVLTPLLSQACKAQKLKLTFKDSLAMMFQIFYYPSQWKAWLGLAPAMLFRVLIFRAAFFIPLESATFSAWPHKGALLYERYGRMERDEFLKVISQSLQAAGFENLVSELHLALNP